MDALGLESVYGARRADWILIYTALHTTRTFSDTYDIVSMHMSNLICFPSDISVTW